MKFRNFISLALFFTGLILAYTGIILFFTPHGRIAYWTDWYFLGLSKTNYADIHTTTALTFLILAVIHIIYNWSSITHYMKNKIQPRFLLTKETFFAVLLAFVIFAGTYWNIPPLSNIVELGESLKDSWGGPQKEPPYGHAELSSIQMICQRIGMDLQTVMSRLREKNIIFTDEKETILSIARKNNVSPHKIFEVMQGSPFGEAKPASLPAFGLGKLILKDVCLKLNLTEQEAFKKLENKKIKADISWTLKQIGDKNKMTPHEIVEVLKGD